MIKLVILDVDGVVLGSMPDINFPFPTAKVVSALLDLQSRGVAISLCTSKPVFAVQRILEKLPLTNRHVADGGAVVFDPQNNEIIKSETLTTQIVKDIMKATAEGASAWDVYTLKSKFVEEGKYNKEKIEDVRIMPFVAVENLLAEVEKSQVTKLELLYAPENENYYKEQLSKFEDQVALQWTAAPALLPNKIVVVTKLGVNKKSTVQELMDYYKVSPEEVLGVGDTLMDWNFMQVCGNYATLSNANEEMQDLVKSKAGFIGGHVNEDGLVDIIKNYFKSVL